MSMKTFDLTGLPLVRPLLRSRWPQLILQLIAFAGFGVALLAGWAGTPVGNRNFGIIAVWIAWWALLILLFVPLLGRAWCSVCPLPLPGEWLTRGTLLGPSAGQDGRPRKMGGMGRRWPARLRNIWLQNALFLMLALFSAVVLTHPGATAAILTAIIALALGVSLIFERRAFCRYLCPVGGFIGLYAQAAPLEVRISDPALCKAHEVKSCYVGSSDGYGCPWGVFPATLAQNSSCGTCMECLRTCPYDNVVVNLRTPGTDLLAPARRRLDEAYKAFIMLGCAMVYSAVMLGPWGALKDAAYQVGEAHWFGYAGAMLGFVLLVLPGAFLLATYLGRRLAKAPGRMKPTYISLAYGLVPLGLAAWMAFSLSFVFANLSYLWPVLSDPMGWGWDLLGFTGLRWQPYLTGLVGPLQVLILVVGMGWTSATTRRIADELGGGLRLAIPPVILGVFATGALLWLLIG